MVAAISRQAEILEHSPDDEERLKALKYVVHLVGDVHQPLHAGYADDKGGNKHQLRAFGRGTNLHSSWDRELLAHRAGGSEAMYAELIRARVDQRNALGEPARWAEESCLRSVQGRSTRSPGSSTTATAPRRISYFNSGSRWRDSAWRSCSTRC